MKVAAGAWTAIFWVASRAHSLRSGGCGRELRHMRKKSLPRYLPNLRYRKLRLRKRMCIAPDLGYVRNAHHLAATSNA